VRTQDITDEDRELYEELYGLPFSGDYRNSLERFEVVPFMDDPFEFIPRVTEIVIDPLMGVSGNEEELIDRDFVERAIKEFEDKRARHVIYQREWQLNKEQ